MTATEICLSLLEAACQQQASDLHVEPLAEQVRVRLRIDGLLQQHTTLDFLTYGALITHIKIRAQMDICQQRLPQDGRFTYQYQDAAVDCRVSTVPGFYGENCVIRLLQQQDIPASLEALGLTEAQAKQLMQHAKKPQGMMLMTGPTGSGKSMTLYTVLQQLHQASIHIVTAEDPVEIALPGITQVSMAPDLGLDFSNVLTYFLRQDPDVLMLGEIRDAASLQLALKAAQTGHLLLSTLHTNSAIDSLYRLKSLGSEHTDLWSTLHCITAQRLLRRLCTRCRQWDKSSQSYLPTGCSACHQGYRGRVAVFEVLDYSETLAELLDTGARSQTLRQQAQEEGMVPMLDHAKRCVQEGTTSLAELKRTLPT